jgi:hypothetical protein
MQNPYANIRRLLLRNMQVNTFLLKLLHELKALVFREGGETSHFLIFKLCKWISLKKFKVSVFRR